MDKDHWDEADGQLHMACDLPGLHLLGCLDGLLSVALLVFQYPLSVHDIVVHVVQELPLELLELRESDTASIRLQYGYSCRQSCYPTA